MSALRLGVHVGVPTDRGFNPQLPNERNLVLGCALPPGDFKIEAGEAATVMTFHHARAPEDSCMTD